MSKQDTQNDLKSLFEMGAHLGHKKSRLHPQARKNVYQIINKTSIIDLTRTVEQLESAKKYMAEVASEGKTILVVGTKKTAAPFVKKYCSEHTLPFVSSKWLPGLLTNFSMIMGNVKKLKSLRETLASDEAQELVKHERTQMQKQISKLERLYAGLESLSAKPEVMVIIDIKKESNAVKEAHEYRIPVVALVDTNADPQDATYPVVANDDDSEVVTYIMTQILEAYTKNFKEKEQPAKKTEAIKVS